MLISKTYHNLINYNGRVLRSAFCFRCNSVDSPQNRKKRPSMAVNNIVICYCISLKIKTIARSLNSTAKINYNKIKFLISNFSLSYAYAEIKFHSLPNRYFYVLS